MALPDFLGFTWLPWLYLTPLALPDTSQVKPAGPDSQFGNFRMSYLKFYLFEFDNVLRRFYAGIIFESKLSHGLGNKHVNLPYLYVIRMSENQKEMCGNCVIRVYLWWLVKSKSFIKSDYR